ncbi:MAG: hypothetical protein B7X10_00720 [Burkholderiales bacterium 21-58-4]|nr:MAG: hypothetical protein B7X10_00720 [Burkholderiales bacterium 21-58-4]
MARPGRPRQEDAPQAAADESTGIPADTVESPRLWARLAHLPTDSAQTRSALDAIATALQDLKARTASVAQHLGPQHADVIEIIKTL